MGHYVFVLAGEISEGGVGFVCGEVEAKIGTPTAWINAFVEAQEHAHEVYGMTKALCLDASLFENEVDARRQLRQAEQWIEDFRQQKLEEEST